MEVEEGSIPAQILMRSSPIGSLVFWNTINGTSHSGRLKEFDNGTAIVEMTDGTEKAVRCD